MRSLWEYFFYKRQKSLYIDLKKQRQIRRKSKNVVLMRLTHIELEHHTLGNFAFAAHSH